MSIDYGFLSLVVVPPPNWGADWAWGLPLIVLTVVIHVLGMGFVVSRATQISFGLTHDRHPLAIFVGIISIVTWLAITLHGIEAWIWSLAYEVLGAVPDRKSAMLYSLSAITSYGHTNMVLPPSWQLLGSLEALNGWLLFGLTTAFMFGAIQKIWNHRELHA